MTRAVGMRKQGRRFLLAGIVLTAVAGFFWYRHVQGVRETGPALPTSPLIESSAQMITRDFRHVETRLNRTVWILEAALAEIFQQKARLMRVKITYFGKGEDSTVITGEHALVDLESWDAELYGNVRALGSDGTVLKTRKLEWNSANQVLRAPWPVRIRNSYGEIQGRRMVARVKEKWFKIVGRVATEFTPPEGLLEPAS